MISPMFVLDMMNGCRAAYPAESIYQDFNFRKQIIQVVHVPVDVGNLRHQNDPSIQR
jgi:hypothetical protein